uniref:Fatty acid-binding protein, liver-like n=1 Tax=Phallusia mammillata TaxID=59560 RepID=A0A6F9DCH9_9ASCI|nr:fatty acid-binding protein, liver-like [Phallusia mammillata]
MVDAFVGKYIVESRDNFDGFMAGVGVPAEYIEKARAAKVETEVKNDGGLVTITRVRPLKTTTNSFRLGEETEMDTIKGDKIKATVQLEGGKLVAKGENYEVVTEMQGGNLKETITAKGHTMSRVSKRV